MEALPLPRQIDVAVFVQRFGDGDEVIARLDGEAAQHVEARPRALPVELALVLASLRTQGERLLAADDVHEELADATGCD